MCGWSSAKKAYIGCRLGRPGLGRSCLVGLVDLGLVYLDLGLVVLGLV